MSSPQTSKSRSRKPPPTNSPNNHPLPNPYDIAPQLPGNATLPTASGNQDIPPSTLFEHWWYGLPYIPPYYDFLPAPAHSYPYLDVLPAAQMSEMQRLAKEPVTEPRLLCGGTKVRSPKDKSHFGEEKLVEELLFYDGVNHYDTRGRWRQVLHPGDASGGEREWELPPSEIWDGLLFPKVG